MLLLCLIAEPKTRDLSTQNIYLHSILLHLLEEDNVLLLELVEGDPHGGPDDVREAAEGDHLLVLVHHDVHTPADIDIIDSPGCR